MTAVMKIKVERVDRLRYVELIQGRSWNERRERIQTDISKSTRVTYLWTAKSRRKARPVCHSCSEAD
jgi:hypothetical protein